VNGADVTGADVTDLDADVVVVGGGAAGATAVRTVLVEDDTRRVLFVTGEAHRPYDRTDLSKAVLAGVRDAPAPLYPDDLDAAADAGRLTLRTSTEVVGLDPDERRLTLDDGTAVTYTAMLLATGAAPRTLPLPGADLAGVHLVREVAALGPLRDAVARGGRGGRLVVLGGGLIGLEVAAAARAHGTEVTVLEVADRLMGRVLPPPIAEVVAAAHAAQGVELHLGVQPTAIEAAPEATSESGRVAGARVAGVRLADGRLIDADDVVIAVGVRPRTELAEAAGLTVDDGVVVDPRLRTSAEGVWAAGDLVRVRGLDGTLARRTEAWTPALAMGQHAARSILGAEDAYTEVPTMWSDQYDLRIRGAGTPVDGQDVVVRGTVDDTAGLAAFGVVDGRVVSVVGIGRTPRVGRTVRAAQQLIERGVQVTPAQLADTEVDLRHLARRP
jgi:3-phenylpropionate/trans-cinnamate dioxygenase ferredoxin reductase subunit